MLVLKFSYLQIYVYLLSIFLNGSYCNPNLVKILFIHNKIKIIDCVCLVEKIGSTPKFLFYGCQVSGLLQVSYNSY